MLDDVKVCNSNLHFLQGKTILLYVTQINLHGFLSTFDKMFVLSAGRMLSLSRAVVSGVARAPAAVSQGGVTAITRFNSTAQVRGLLSCKTKVN